MLDFEPELQLRTKFRNYSLMMGYEEAEWWLYEDKSEFGWEESDEQSYVKGFLVMWIIKCLIIDYKNFNLKFCELNVIIIQSIDWFYKNGIWTSFDFVFLLVKNLL